MSPVEVMTAKLDVPALLAQTGWTRALARSLASDAHLADDLVQDAWVAALERPPDLGRPVRGWLASVLRNRWVDLSRGRNRRTERERGAASEEALPSSRDVVERAEVLRELVGAVLALDEPYRTTVLLRFFEELPQREVARRMQTTTATVNSRLTRALAKLRGRLSRGGRGSWLHVLVPLLREPAAPAAALGALAMKVVAVSVVALSVLAGFVLWSSRSEPESPSGSRPIVAASPPDGRLESARPGATPVQRPELPDETRVSATEAPAPSPEPEPAPTQPVRILRGRVVDAGGAPLSGVALALSAEGSKSTCTSGAGGRFEIALDVPAESIVATDPELATVLAGSAGVRGATEPIVVVAPRIDLAGSVIDEVRAPLAEATVELALPPGFGSEWGVALDYSLPQRWRAKSRADGRFDLSAVPAIPGSRIAAVLAGFAPHAEEAPPASNAAIEIVLSHPAEATGLVRGVVLDPSGARVEGARVSAGAEIALTDDRGAFRLDVRLEGTRERLVALKPGLLPATFEPEKDAGGRVLWPTEVVMQLSGPAATVRGRVVDADGAPVEGAKVWLDDPTSFGRTPDARLTAEGLLRNDDRFWSFERTDADGNFSLSGLLARPYRIAAVDPRTLAGAESEPVTAADPPVEIRLPTRDVLERVAGRVVTQAGKPIRGVSVRLVRITFELEHEHGTDNEAEQGEPVVTGDDGAFEFKNVPKEGILVIGSGDTILGTGGELRAFPDPTRLELVASLRLHLQVEVEEPRDRVDRLQVFDAQGRTVLLSVFHGVGAHASFEMPIRDGRSDVLSVEERAATLVLFRGSEEVARLPLALAPGPANVVRY